MTNTKFDGLKSNPKLRFPKFRTARPWGLVKLASVLSEHGLKDNGRCEVHSVSVHKGVVNQKEHLGRSYAASDTSNYNLVRLHDIIYTKSPTGEFPFGVVKQSKTKSDVIVSPLYGVFEPINQYVGSIISAYFDSPYRARAFLEPIVKKGAKNTIQIPNEVFLSQSIPLPLDIEEQKQVAGCLASLDALMEAETRRIDALARHKMAVTQGLFPATQERDK